MPIPDKEEAHAAKAQVLNTIESDGKAQYDQRMEARIAKLEEFAADTKERLVKIESRLEQSVTKAELAVAVESITKHIGEIAERHTKQNGDATERLTKEIGDVRAEIHRSIGDLGRWVAGIAIGICVAAVTVMTFVLNNANHQTPSPAPAVNHTQPASAPTKPTPK